jgi:hypothetical protein
LKAVAYSQQGKAGIVHPFIRRGALGGIDRFGGARKNEAPDAGKGFRREGAVSGKYLRVNAHIPDAPAYKLGSLAAEIKDQYLIHAVSKSRGI